MRIRFQVMLMFTVMLLAGTVCAQQGEWQSRKLRNGLLVTYCQDSTRQLAHIGLNLRGGASLDKWQSDGLAAMYEHLFFQYLPDSTPAKEAMNHGLLLSHATKLESQFFGLSLPEEQLETGLQMLRMGLDAKWWTQKQLSAAQNEIAPVLQAQDDAPEHHLESEVLEELWRENASRKRIPGKYTDMLRITSVQIQSVTAAYRHPGNCVLSASSAAPAESFFELAESWMANWQPISAGAMLPAFELPKPESDIYFTTVNEFATQPLIMMAWPVGDPDKMALRDKEARLFCSMAQLKQSKMHSVLVGSGLAKNYSWSYAGGSQSGQLLLYVLPDPAQFQTCLQAVQNLIPTLPSDTVLRKSDLAVAKRQKKLSDAMRKDQSIPRLMNQGKRTFSDPDSLAAKAKIGIEDIHGFAEKYLAGQPHVAGLLANSKTVFTLGADTLFQPPVVAVATPVDAGPKVVHIDPATLRGYRIYFVDKTMRPDSAAGKTLAHIAEMLKSQPNKRIYLNGYAEGVGDGVTNYQLSIQRCKSIRKVLSLEYGVPMEQLVIRAYGEAFPEYDDDTADHRHKNRRVSFNFATQDAVDNAY